MRKTIIERIGEPAVLENLAEECVELAKCALKLARIERGENPTPVTREMVVARLEEETADVLNVMQELVEAGVIHTDTTQKVMKAKRYRWNYRIEAEEKKK